MSYPKPLSERSLEKMYREAGLSEKKREFLHALFAACAHLYGAIDMRGVWEVYRQMKNAPSLHRKELLAFSSIARREEQPYFVFEIEELYEEEKHNELDRHIVHRDLVDAGYGKFSRFYSLMENRRDLPFAVPEDLLLWAERVGTPEKEKLLRFLSGLRSTAEECVSGNGEARPNENRGKRLDEFSFLNREEKAEQDYFIKGKSKRELLAERTKGPEAEKALRNFEQMAESPWMGPEGALQSLLEEVREAGAELTDAQTETLVGLAMEYHNHRRLWSLNGWSPAEAFQRFSPSGPIAVSFGPGIRKAFGDGSMDREELTRKLREMGITVLD